MAAVKKVGQKNGGLLVEYLFCDTVDQINYPNTEYIKQ